MEKNNKKGCFFAFMISLMIAILINAIITYSNNNGLLLKDSIQTQAKVIEVGDVETHSTGKYSYSSFRRITYCYEGNDGKEYIGKDVLSVSLFNIARYKKEAVGETIDISFHTKYPEKSMIGKPKYLLLIDDFEDFLFVLIISIAFWPVVCYFFQVREKRKNHLKENVSTSANVVLEEEMQASSKQLKSIPPKKHEKKEKQEELPSTPREMAIRIYRSQPNLLRELTSVLADDKEFALAIIDLEYSEERGDKYPAIYFLSERLKDDEEVVMEAIKRRPYSFSYASVRLQNDRDFVLKAVQNGLSLGYLNELFRNDREIVLAAIPYTNFFVLEYIGKSLRDDKEIVLNVFLKEVDSYCVYINPFEYLGPTIKNDKEVIKTALLHNPFLYRYLDDSFKKDTSFLYEVLLELVQKDGMEIKLSEEWLSLKEDSIELRVLALHAVKQNGMALQHVGKILADDKEIVLEAIKNCKGAISFASFRLMEDEDVVRIVQS